MEESRVNNELHESINKLDKIREIVKREIKIELDVKEQEALEIEEQIFETKRQLNKLRYAIISNYYKSSSSEIHREVQRNIEANSLVSSGVTEFDQKSLHPTLKKLIGKRPVSDHIDVERKKRSAERDTSSTSSVKVMPKPLVPRKQDLLGLVKPSAIDTAIRLTSSRGKNTMKHLMVVGNTSQFIEEKSSIMTHKWMCFVKTQSTVPIEKLVKRVQFHLDSSYKPNDIVDVDIPPFQIIRRGYGEFTIKVLVFFRDEIDIKPVQIYHQLHLDKKLSGHQSMGRETLSEFWTMDIFGEKMRGLNRDESCFLIDHNYFKTRSHPDKNEIDGGSPESCLGSDMSPITHNDQLSSVLEWIHVNSSKVLEMSRTVGSCIDVESTESPNGSVTYVEDEDIDIEIERQFVESSCRKIGLLPASFEQSSMKLLVTSLKLFLKNIIEKSPKEKNQKVIGRKDIENAIQSTPHLDFLYDLVQ